MRKPVDVEAIKREQYPTYPLWWETLPPEVFNRLKQEWEQEHEYE